VRWDGWEHGLLVIDDTAYCAEATWAGDDRGHVWVIVDLTNTRDGQRHRLTLGPGGDDVWDCPHATYRDAVCKHASAVRAALQWLEDVEL
jgi:hypothetical protein